MDIHHGVQALPLPAKPSVVTVGFFDGVHLGHRRVFAQTVDAARRRGARAVAITFDRHPREVLSPGKEPRLLTTLERKSALIEETGIDALVVLEFNEPFSRWTAEEFVDRILVEGVHAVHAVVGTNFTFGYRAAGTLEVLSALGARWGMTVEGLGLFELQGSTVSSSSIRAALAEGDLDWPERALGRRFVVDGTVVAGAGRGAAMGYPTANLRTWPRLLLPGGGIYAGRARHDGSEHLAAISVGTNPTFGVEPLHVEAYLLDYPGADLRGRPIAVEFWARLRDEVRFDSVDDLVGAIAGDVERTRALVPPPEDR